MRQILVFLIIITLTSCEYFKVKKTSSEAILQEELKTFNWNEVDEYPSFTSCDSLSLKQDRKQCFIYTLTNHIYGYLQRENIIVTQDINDTMSLNFKVSEKGFLTLLDYKIDSLTIQEIPNIRDLLNQSLDSIPKIYPAIKRGQQVTTEFKLPIIIHVK